MNVRVDITGILERAGADADAPEGSQAWALAQASRAVTELIQATGTLLERNSQWDDDEEPETSEAAASRNEHVRMHKRAKAALTALEVRS